MTYTSKEIHKKVAALNLPLGQYVLIGGSGLAVRGFRDTRDVDILVTKELFNNLATQGFVFDQEYEEKWNRKRLKKDDIEVYADMYLEKENIFFNVNEIISEADIVQDLPVQSLANLIICKKDSAREKDLQDIELIKDQIKQQFKNNGYIHVFEWVDKPNTLYEEHEHKGRTAFYVTQGSVTFTSGLSGTFKTGDRLDVPLGVKHTAVVGSEGCEWIVAEEIEGDS